MKRIKYILLFLLVVACSGEKDIIPDKSIFEPLTVDELAPIIKQDTLFVDFYESLQEEVEDYTDIEKAKFNDITYRSLYRACEKLVNREQYEQFTAPYYDEWGNKFGKTLEEADSLFYYWERYRNEHNFQEFVKVEVVDLVKVKHYSTTDVNLVFRITPMGEPLKNVNIDYTTRFKGTVDHTQTYIYPSTGSGVLWLFDINEPCEKQKELDYSSEEYMLDRSFEDFQKDFDVDIRVTSVTVGEDLYMEDVSVYPEGVLKVLKNGPYSPGVFSMDKADVIKANINPNYVDMWQYVEDRVKEYMEKNHPREYAFMMYTEKRSKRR